MFGELPKQLEVAGVYRNIRTNYKDIINILIMFEDPDLSKEQKVWDCLDILYYDLDSIPQKDYDAAFQAALKFIDHGIEQEKEKSPHLMDWEKDEPILIPAINKVAGFDIRSVKYIHWWTFLGYYMEIGESIFAQVVNVRNKKAKKKKLNDVEKDFYKHNQALIKLPVKRTKEEQEKYDKLNALTK